MNRLGCFLLLICAATSWAQTSTGPKRQETEYYVAAYAQHYRVPVPLVRAVVERESNWRPCAISPKGAAGLMQLMPTTARKLRVSDRCNIDQNVSGGVRYLAWLIQKFRGDLRLASAAYYAGEDIVSRRGLAYRNPEVLSPMYLESEPLTCASPKRKPKFSKPLRKEIYDENLPKFVSSHNAPGMLHPGGSTSRFRARQDSQSQSGSTERYHPPITTWICNVSSPTRGCQFRGPW